MLDMLPYYELYNRRVITVEELEKRMSKESFWNWFEISSIPALPEAFIEKYKDEVDWCEISKHVKLSEAFVEKYANRIDWRELIERCESCAKQDLAPS